MKRKGFTLIELLAVIVILAIIALIATPIILNIIDTAKKGAAKSSAYGVVDALRLKYAENLLDGSFKGATYNFEDSTGDLLGISTKPEKGKVSLDSSGNMKGNVTYNGYTFYICNGKVSEEPSLEEDCGEIKVLYEESILNEALPNIEKGMIPVYYNGSNWVVADIYNQENTWYSYSEKRWANVITVKEEVRNNYVENNEYKKGTVVNEEDVLTYLVWIPRFKYRILPDIDNIQIDADYEINNTQIIDVVDVVFENKNTSKSTGTNVGEYLTHPAFTFGDEELNGMWVGKFESSNLEGLSENNSSLTLTVKPNVSSWTNIQVANAFTASTNMNDENNIYGLSTSSDSHMMKNSEWGAVVYLSASIYGQGINEIRINNSSTYTTGCAATTPATANTSSTEYLEQTDGSEGWFNGCENTYNTEIGVLASTTGNIYGIYDMSGGTWEYVMGVIEDSPGSGVPMSGNRVDANSGFTGKLYDGTTYTGIAFPDSKYYNLYLNNSGTYPSHPWVFRGGYFDMGASSGISVHGSSLGYERYSISFRVVIS